MMDCGVLTTDHAYNRPNRWEKLRLLVHSQQLLLLILVSWFWLLVCPNPTSESVEKCELRTTRLTCLRLSFKDWRRSHHEAISQNLGHVGWRRRSRHPEIWPDWL